MSLSVTISKASLSKISFFKFVSNLRFTIECTFVTSLSTVRVERNINFILFPVESQKKYCARGRGVFYVCCKNIQHSLPKFRSCEIRNGTPNSIKYRPPQQY